MADRPRLTEADLHRLKNSFNAPTDEETLSMVLEIRRHRRRWSRIENAIAVSDELDAIEEQSNG